MKHLFLTFFEFFFCHCTVHILPSGITKGVITGPFSLYSRTVTFPKNQHTINPCAFTYIRPYDTQSILRPVAPHDTNPPHPQTFQVAPRRLA